MTSCSRKSSDPAKPAGAVVTSAAAPTPSSPVAVANGARRGRPKGERELPTTSGSIAEANLDAQVGELERLVKLAPRPSHIYVERLRGLSDLHVTRGTYRGDVRELQLAMDQINECIGLEPKNAELFRDRAAAHQMLHRFPQARADIERARTLGASDYDLSPVVQELDWQQGSYEAAIRLIRAARAKRPTLMSVAREALVEDELGHHEVAERLFEEAEDLARDTSPFPVAWLDVQRGIQQVHIGKTEEALAFFREAVRRLPRYVLANQHLAETLQKLGQEDEAVQIFEELVSRSKNPELAAGLSKLYRARGKIREADELVARARQDYEALLSELPEAMSWHAAEFFRSVTKEPKRAAELLRQNVALRPNSASFTALARAQLAADDVDGASVSIEKALAMPLRCAGLYWVAGRVSDRRGDARKSEEFDRKAREENPKVDQDFCMCR